MLLELLIRGVRRWRPVVGWSAFIVTVIAVLVVAQGVMDAEWVRGDILFFYVALVSALLSAVLAHSRISGKRAALVLGLVGLLYTSEMVARFLPPLSGSLSELWNGITWLWLRLRQPDLLPPAFPLWSESGARLATFGARLVSWGVGLVIGQSELNPAAFLSVSGSILWASAAWALWNIIRRGRPLLAMLPLGLVLSMSTYLSSGQVGYLIGFVACVTLLLPIVRLNRQEQRWEREGTDYSLEIRFDVWQLAVLSMLIIVLFSIITPSFSIPRLVHGFWKLISRPQEMFQEFLIRFFGGVEPASPPEIPVVPSGQRGTISASLPRSHLLGGNPDLSNQIVMYVCTDAPPPMPEEFLPEQVALGPKYYWRGITYDIFTGRYWANRPSLLVEVPAYEPVLASTVTNTKSLRQRYLIEVPHGSTLYAVGEPHTVDQLVESRRRKPNDLVGLEGDLSDYVVHSQVPQATVGQLESASETYSEHIVEHYLAVPEQLPERIRTLALEITQDAGSAYEKAVAIESYLRQFAYDLDVPSPPPEQDVVDYFLFDAQRGYCDYYASSFVVLARLAGVPARLAVGYAMGEYEPDRNCYRVTEMNAHSWPEVYFANYGWIPFEPTAPFRRFERPEDPASPSDQQFNVIPIPKRQWYIVVREWWRRTSRYWTTYVAIASTAVLLVTWIVWEYRRWRHSLLSPVERIASYYTEMSRLGQRLGATRRPHDTPAEYGAVLASAIRARVARWPWRGKKLVPIARQARVQVRAVSKAYERASYSAHPLAEPYQVQVERQWRQLQRQLRWLRFASKVIAVDTVAQSDPG